MNKKEDQAISQPMIVRFSTSMNCGIEPLTIARHAIGYVVRGEKYIYDGDSSLHAQRGDIFFMGKGLHHIENVSEKFSHFEQIVFYFSSEELKHIITTFGITYDLNITNDHCCERCRTGNSVITKTPTLLKNFFNSAIDYLYDENFSHDQAAENIKMTELIYHIISQEDCCLKNKVVGCIDLDKSSFEQVIYANTFNDIPIDQLATMSNRSLTSFKKEFRRIFETSPHQWFLRQRLSHARLLLISTRKSIAQIGQECSFPNTSHFIKLFKRSYDLTPANYRQQHLKLVSITPTPVKEPNTKIIERETEKVV
ncbi:MAG: AraC family transcriptional regulator [Rikenellaceae bacterium]